MEILQIYFGVTSKINYFMGYYLKSHIYYLVSMNYIITLGGSSDQILFGAGEGAKGVRSRCSQSLSISKNSEYHLPWI